MNSIDTSRKIKFTISLAHESVLKFLDLSLHIDEENKICVDVYAKATNSYIGIASFYILSSKEHKRYP